MPRLCESASSATRCSFRALTGSAGFRPRHLQSRRPISRSSSAVGSLAFGIRQEYNNCAFRRATAHTHAPDRTALSKCPVAQFAPGANALFGYIEASSGAAMPKSERQAAVDIPTLTRGEVAKRLGRDVSWVRRREGKELHPRFFDGAHQFDPHEVDALRAQLEAQKKEAEVSDAATEAIHQMFEMHAKAPRRFSVDGIAARTGASPQVVRSMHSNWLEGKEPSAPRLLTR